MNFSEDTGQGGRLRERAVQWGRGRQQLPACMEERWGWAGAGPALDLSGRLYTPCGPGAFSVGAGESEPTLSA